MTNREAIEILQSKEIEITGSATMVWKFIEALHLAREALYEAGYRKQSGWISVDERLPTEEEYRDEYGELIPILVTEKDTTYPYRALYDGKTWGDGLTAIPTITHWMPLPEPPEMKGGESDARN